jgi:cold shock CspA family protein
MTSTIKSLDPKGFGIIDAQDGSKIPFLFTDVRNQRSLEIGQRVVFSVRRIEDKAFAENIDADRLASTTAATMQRS